MTADSFYTELKRLLSLYPKTPPDLQDCENCDYGDYLAFSKDMFVAFDTANSTDCYYVYDSYIAKNCVDCDYTIESELCYESVDPFKCFNSDYIEYGVSLRDAMYSANCINCHDVFGCVNLQNKSFCIFNRQLTESEYRQKVALYKKWPAEKVLAMVEELKLRYPLTQTREAHNENSAYGNYSHYNSHCYMIFDGAHNEACAYLYDSHHNATSYDLTCSYQHNEVSYQLVDGIKLFNCNFAVHSSNSFDSSYIFNCRNVKNCLGCVSLNNKQYCILNRQLSKEDYETISKKLLAVLKEKNLAWSDLKI
jgi:hypothetical protein